MNHESNDLLKITQSIVEETIKLLGEKIYKIILFGSYARGDYTPDSDIDIMILLNCSKEELKDYRKEISRLSSRIGLENDVEVSLQLRDRISFEEGQNVIPFYRNIQKEGIALYE